MPGLDAPKIRERQAGGARERQDAGDTEIGIGDVLSDKPVRRAEMLSRSPGSIGAVAFSRTGDPMIGEFGDAHLLRKFGNVPDDLGGL